MLFVYDKKDKVFAPSQETDFKSHEILERRDLEKWVTDFPDILGEDLLVITTEYDKFDKTKERLDLLCIDRMGKLVVVELKRDDSGKSVELQAIKYAAYCSNLLMKDVSVLRKNYLEKRGRQISEMEAEEELFAFVRNEDFERLDDKPRIILVSREYTPEVTSAVLWLRKFDVDITCVKLTPYKIDENRIGLVSSTLIPLPEAEEYIVKSERKENLENVLTRSQLEYLEFFGRLSGKFGKRLNLQMPEPKGQSYYPIPTGLSGIHYEWGFHGRPRNAFGVELHFEKGDKTQNIALLAKMETLKDEIEKETGEKITFQRDWGKTWSRLYIEKNEGEMTPELEEWALEKMLVLHKLLQPKLEKEN